MRYSLGIVHGVSEAYAGDGITFCCWCGVYTLYITVIYACTALMGTYVFIYYGRCCLSLEVEEDSNGMIYLCLRSDL